MGMTVSGTVTYGKPLVASLASMPAVVVAFSEAVIDKTYLAWLDVSKLLTAFPEHVKVLGDAVTFKGPVAIISPLSPTQRLFAKCMLGLACGVITFLFLKAISPRPRVRSFIPKPTSRRMFITNHKKIFTLLAAGLGFYAVGRFLPTQAGIYFYRLPPYLLSSGIEA